MNELTCREIDELLPGYAADALEEADRCAAASHLAECRNHDVDLRALRQSFAGLASIVEPVEPPAGLRGRLLDAFDHELAGPAPASLPERRSQRSRLISAAGFGYALAAALLIIAVALGAWGASRGGDQNALLFASRTDSSGSITVTYVPSRGLGVLEYNLSAPPAGSVYQAWHIDEAGTPLSLGILPDQRGSIGLIGEMARSGSVALTVEPAGGSRAPTTTPFLVTSLSES